MSLFMLAVILVMPASVMAEGSQFDTYLEKSNFSTNDTVFNIGTDKSNEFVDDLLENTSDKWTSKNQSDLKNMIKKYGSTTESEGGDPVKFTVNTKIYYLNEAEYKKIVASVVSVAKKYEVKNSVEQVADFNTKADVGAASVALSGIEGIVSVVVGILVYAVTIGMTLFTACDICYITMPVFRDKCDTMKQSGSIGTTKTSSGETKLMFVTDDAQYAVQSCSVETGKNPLTVYMKKRVLAFILLGLVLFILFTGNIQLIVNVVVNLVSGIIDALGGLGA